MTQSNPEQQQDEQATTTASHGVVTIVLTADNHLGQAAFGHRSASGSGHPRKREEHQQRLRHAFGQATDFAIGQGVDFFLQAGDLFDTTTPDERDRSFVAARLAQLRSAGIRTFALGGVHDTPIETHSSLGEVVPAPHISYARLGALHYFPPHKSTPNALDSSTSSRAGTASLASSSSSLEDSQEPLEPVIVEVRNMRIALCGLGVLPHQQGDILQGLPAQGDIERADFSILLLHAPIEGLPSHSSPLHTHAHVRRSSISKQSLFPFILAGYHHTHHRLRIGQCDLIVAGSTQHSDFSFNDPAQNPGFVFLGLAADGVRWCTHIAVDAVSFRHLVVQTSELWPHVEDGLEASHHKQERVLYHDPTDLILERLRIWRQLDHHDVLVQLRLVGELTRRQYHQLDLNRLRRYGEEQCFALSIDDSALSLLPEQQAVSAETGERFSPREELVALADEWIAATNDEQEKKALQVTKEELLEALDEVKRKRELV